MFKTYNHAELGPADIFGEPSTRHWQFIELEMHHPWFYFELVRNYGDDIVGSMLMIPTVPILREMLLELDDRSWFAQAHVLTPGHMREGGEWMMERLVEVSVAQDDSGTTKGYVFMVEGGGCYSLYHSPGDNLHVTELIFSAKRDLRAL